MEEKACRLFCWATMALIFLSGAASVAYLVVS